MAFSPRRSFALAGVAALSTCAIWVSPARPAEEGWPSPIPVAGGNPVHGKPVYAGPGDLLYFWEDGAGLRVAPVSDGGLGPTQDLTQNAAIDGDLASDEHGDAMTVRGERSSSTTSPQDSLSIATRQPDGTFGSPQSVTYGSGFLAQPIRIAMNSRGDAVVVYAVTPQVDSLELRAVFRPAGGSFGAPMRLATFDLNQADVGELRLALDDGGIATVAWEHRVNESSSRCGGRCYSYVPHSIDVTSGTSAGFAPLHEISAADGQLDAPSLAVNSSGAAVLAWRTQIGFTWSIWASLRSAGGQFGPAQDLEVDSSSGHTVDALVRPDGSAGVVTAQSSPNRMPPVGLVISGDTSSGQFGARTYLGQADFTGAAAARNGAEIVAWDTAGSMRAIVTEPDGTALPVRTIYCGGPALVPAVAADPADGGAVVRQIGDPGTAFQLIHSTSAVGPGGFTCQRADPPVGLPPGFFIPYDPQIQLVSPPAHDATDQLRNPWSNGGSGDLAFSQDNRNARLLGFDSDASNLVVGDANGVRDVFVFERDPGGGVLTGGLVRVSVASTGAEPNGPSSHPSLDGDATHAPHCVAFESEATNLDPRDRTHDRDVFLRDLASGHTRLISVGLRDAIDPVVDGACRNVTFEAKGNVYVAATSAPRPLRLARGSQPDQQTNGRGVAYVRGGQVWYRPFSLRGRHLRLGRERLASDDRRGRPGNGRSSHPSLDDAGRYVAFESTATNLCIRRCHGVSKDVNGHISDVFRRTLTRFTLTHDSMEMVSYSYRAKTQGNGPSNDAQISGGGEDVVFDSVATNFRRSDFDMSVDRNGSVRDVFSWIFPADRGFGDVERYEKPNCGWNDCPALSTHPAISSRGNYVAYASPMAEFCGPKAPRFPGNRPCPSFTDVFIRFVGYSHEGYPLG